VCGICGFVGATDHDVLLRMREALVHRGPDEGGSFTDGDVSLASRRLAIVDPSHGQQPLVSDDGSIVVVFNGEIYNHPRLRARLESEGHRYRTQADTESILHAYERFDTGCVEHLDGMFAFVLFDLRRRWLFGARDRLGKKPLYYTAHGFGERDREVRFAFASELKSLAAHPAIVSGRRLNPKALVRYLLNDYVLGRQSIYEGIERLGAGCAFTFGLPGSQREGFRSWSFWRLPWGEHEESTSGQVPSEAEASRRVVELLDAAVADRLMADVPLGAFLSGGIDSSTVVALLCGHRPPGEIQTFSIAFEEPSFDESTFARQVAGQLGTRHRERTFTSRDLLDELPHVVAMLDEPFADPSILPFSLLSKFARQHVTVALGGDGGDELFAGYDPLRALAPARLYRRLVRGWLHGRVIQPLAARLPRSEANLSWDFLINRFLRGARMDEPLRLAAWMGSFDLAGLQRLLPNFGDELKAEVAHAEMIAAFSELAADSADGLTPALDFYERFYLVDDILVKVDRGSMMHSLEVRSPFLDTALVEYVNRLPFHYKLRGRTAKYLLKRAVTSEHAGQPLVPRSIAYRRKKGFGIPLARWIRGELRDEFREVLGAGWPRQLDMFERREIARLLDEHLVGAANNYKELWALFMLAQWARRYL